MDIIYLKQGGNSMYFYNIILLFLLVNSFGHCGFLRLIIY